MASAQQTKDMSFLLPQVNLSLIFSNHTKHLDRCYFDLDAWYDSKISTKDLPEEAEKTYPLFVVPKPSQSEKKRHGINNHPTVKPLKLMSYLITMGSREGDLVLDPFAGSGTTLEAANLLKRRFIGCESDEKYRDIIEARAHVRGYSR